MARKSEKKQEIEGIPAPRAPGRPSMLTPEIQKKIVNATRRGAFSWVAASVAGISATTHFRWMGDGKIESEIAERDGTLPGKFGQYYEAVTRARAQARYGAERTVMKSAPLAWLTKGPGRDKAGEPGWSDSNKIELSGPNGGPIPTEAPTHDLSRLTFEELKQYETLVSKAALPEPA